MSIWTAAALSAALLLQQAAPTTSPAPAPASDQGTEVDSLTVTARKAPEREAIEAFVSSVSDMTANRRLGRWDRKVCPGVMGLQNNYAQVMIDRIATTATEIGLEVGEPGCKANMIVIATAESDKLVRQMVKEHPDAFAKFDSGVRRSRRDLDRFVASDAPIRWWHVIGRTTADGQRYDLGQSLRVRDVGRLKGGTRDDFATVIIILDVKRVGKLKFSSLADYVAMVGLAQVDPDADTAGISSVLNLFADRKAGVEPVDALSDWDRAYLKGLYEARRDVRRGASQEDDIATTIGEELAKGEAKKKD